jgi:hypothetical protein
MLHYAIPCFELAVDQPTRYRSTYPQFVADCERGRRHAHVRLPSHGPSAGHRKYLVVDEAVSLFLDFVILYYEQLITGTTRYFYSTSSLKYQYGIGNTFFLGSFPR